MPLPSRAAPTAGQSAPPATNEPPLFLAEENARLTQAAQAAINPFLASRVVREPAALPAQPPAQSSIQQAAQPENRRHLTWPASSQGSAPQSADPSVKSEDTDEEDESSGSDAEDSEEEGYDNEERQVDADLSLGNGEVRPGKAPPLPFELHKNSVSGDVSLLRMSLIEEWEEARKEARAIIRASIPRKKSIEVKDIDFALAASKLVHLIRKSFAQVARSGALPSAASQSCSTLYAGVAASIALEVFASTPPEWSVRRTSFAVAGYYGALSRCRESTPPRQKKHVFRFTKFAHLSQKVFWALRGAKDGSRYLEAEAEDISAAIALTIGTISILGKHLDRRLHSCAAEHLLPQVLRCKSYLDKLEASVKFVQRCPEAREWGAGQVVTQHIFPNVSSIEKLCQDAPRRFAGAKDAALVSQTEERVFRSCCH
jgi:hypothetical protein